MTEEKQAPAARRKATKEEREEASEVIHQLQESGDFRRLQEDILCTILYDHPEWWDEMRQTVRDTVKAKEGGVLDITLDEMSAELVKTGKSAVPEEVKQQILAKIQATIQSTAARR